MSSGRIPRVWHIFYRFVARLDIFERFLNFGIRVKFSESAQGSRSEIISGPISSRIRFWGFFICFSSAEHRPRSFRFKPGASGAHDVGSIERCVVRCRRVSVAREPSGQILHVLSPVSYPLDAICVCRSVSVAILIKIDRFRYDSHW